VTDVMFYVSSHGFGHAARQQGLIALLAERGVRVHVLSLIHISEPTRH